MRYASVCSGVEAASLAWMPLGWEAAWFSEIEPFPCAVLEYRFPNVPNLGDMTKIKVENLKNGDQKFTGGNGTTVTVPGGVDLLVGGTPCQDLSIAGKRKGFGGDRSVLALTYIELLDVMRPRWFVWENVPGVFSSRGGEDFRTFVRKIDEIGYSLAWRVLDAQYVRVDGFPYAIPQRRRRVFIVGHSSADWRYPASVLFERQSEKKLVNADEPPPRKSPRYRTCGIATLCEHAEMIEDCAPCLIAKSRDMYTSVTDGEIVRRYTPVECERLMGFPDNWTRIPWRGKPEKNCPDGPCYKACGNSMCVNVMRWIGMRIELAERRKNEN